jgi:hypothetical protein
VPGRGKKGCALFLEVSFELSSFVGEQFLILDAELGIKLTYKEIQDMSLRENDEEPPPGMP